MATPPVERSPRGRGNGPRDYQTEFRNRLIDSRLTPNAISLTGFALCLVAAGLIWQGWWIAGGIAFIVGSVCDTLDGRYSRMSGKASPFGAFLDSTLDRVEEGVVLAAVAYRFSRDEDLTFILSNDIAVAAVVVAVIASIMVSYTRARAEALGVECKVGIADRAFRVVVLSAGLVFGDLKAIEPAVYVLAVMAVVTVFQRIFHVRSELTKPVTEAV
jgi:CDP-diacylglycerol--glycerol-3-phosphate 3-phosphatidyltransferase